MVVLHRERARSPAQDVAGGLRWLASLLVSLHVPVTGCAARGTDVETTAIGSGDATGEDAARTRPSVVCIDEAHANFHTRGGRYEPFAAALAEVGFHVVSLNEPFSSEGLTKCDVLVVSNALHPANVESWRSPIRDAFAEGEPEAVRRFVERGGGLLLVADHMPFPAAAASLAEVFGVTFTNGFAVSQTGTSPDVFTREAGTLGVHEVTEGVEVVASFTGQAFRAPDGSTSLLRLPSGFVSLEPDVAWEFDDATPRHDVGGWSQGLVLERGDGRVAIWGEAAMFTTQTVDGGVVGIGAAEARDNSRLRENLVRWLARCGSMQCSRPR